MLRLLAASILLCLALLPPASPRVQAAPLGVRASARLEATGRLDADTWSLVLTLTADDGTPLALTPLTAHVEGLAPIALVTDAAGLATLTLPPGHLAAPGSARSIAWTARFPGSHIAAPAEFSGRLDLTRLPTRINLASEATVFDLTSPPASFVVALTTAEARPAPLTTALVRFRVDDGPFQHARTDTSGRLSFLIDPAVTPASSARPGPLVVETVFDGDPLHAASRATFAVPRRVLSRITLRVAREGDATVGRLRFSGRASHEFGAWTDAPVRVMVTSSTGGKTFALPTMTDSRGIWNASIPLEQLRQAGFERIAVTAHAAPQPGLKPAETSPLLLEVPRIPGRSAIVPIIVVGLLLLGLRLADPDTRRAIAARLRRLLGALGGAVRRLAPRKASKSLPSLGPVPGIVTAASLDSPRRPHVLELAFRDRDTTLPLQVHVVFEWHGADGIDDSGETRATGSFLFEARGSGTCHLHVTAPGIVPLSLAVPMPHNGAWDGATVSLRRIERRLREIHETFGKTLGVQTVWGRDTPRDILRHARKPSHDAQLPALVDTIERAYFGPLPPTLADLESAEALVAQGSAREPSSDRRPAGPEEPR